MLARAVLLASPPCFPAKAHSTLPRSTIMPMTFRFWHGRGTITSSPSTENNHWTLFPVCGRCEISLRTRPAISKQLIPEPAALVARLGCARGVDRAHAAVDQGLDGRVRMGGGAGIVRISEGERPHARRGVSKGALQADTEAVDEVVVE